MKKIYSHRTFLNNTKSKSAYAIANIESDTYKTEKGEKLYTNATLDLHDCSRKVTLDFDFENNKEDQAALKKVQKLQTVINNFAQALEKQINNVNTIKK